MAEKVVEMHQRVISTETNVTGYGVLQMLSERRKIAGNKSTDAELQSELQSVGWQKHSGSYPRWIDPIVINEAPRVPFGKTVEYQGVIFEIPEKYQGKKDIALVLDSSTIKISNPNGTGLLTGTVLKNLYYPKQDGWYLQDKDTGIPVGELSPSENPDARYLWRSPGARIGPAARGFDDYLIRRGVAIGVGLGDRLVVAFVEQTALVSKTVSVDLVAEFRPVVHKLSVLAQVGIINPEIAQTVRKVLRALE